MQQWHRHVGEVDAIALAGENCDGFHWRFTITGRRCRSRNARSIPGDNRDAKYIVFVFPILISHHLPSIGGELIDVAEATRAGDLWELDPFIDAVSTAVSRVT